MHEMQTIATDVSGVCLSVSHAAQLGSVHAVSVGSLGAASAKLLWPLVIIITVVIIIITHITPAGTGDEDASLAPFPFFGVGLVLPFLSPPAFFRASSSAATARFSASSWASRAAISAAS